MPKRLEITINVHWGHIAGIAWGNANQPLVLMFHGLMDNAGTFNHLIPYLPKTFYYVSIDLPGHGKSSHFPPFFPIYSVNMLLAYKLVFRHFNRSKFTIIGHSYGGQLGLLFAQLYPEFVEKLILLDAIYLFPTSADDFVFKLRATLNVSLNQIDGFKKSDELYNRQDALEKLLSSRMGYMTIEAGEVLLERNIILANESMYQFCQDRRNRYYLNPVNGMDYMSETLKYNPVQCPILMFLMNESLIQQTYMDVVLKALKENCNVTIEMIDGNHDCHLNTPLKVSPQISRFLIGPVNKL